MQSAAGSLARELRKLEQREACEPGRWSPIASLAGELGVPRRKLARWLLQGTVPPEFMERVQAWAQARAERDLSKTAERGRVEALIEEAKKPAYVKALTPGAPRKFAHRAPDLRTGEGLTDSEERSGYKWDLRIEAWTSFELIDEWCEWAASRHRPAGMLAKPAPAWIVTALCTIYHPHGRDLGSPGRRRGPRSAGARRQFERSRDPQRMGRDLSINTPVSSGTVKRGGLARAVSLFRESMLAEHCEFEQVFVHGLIVRNWRWRNETERRNYRGRATARITNEQRLRELAQEKAKAKKRALARQKALARRGKATSPRSSTPRRTRS